jgi:hypothetical protein
MCNPKKALDGSDKQFEIYRLMVETWKWQINSNWHRTDYFAAFQTALLLATGKVLLDRHFCAGLTASAFGLALNIGWILNDRKTGAYTAYWRKAAESLEAELPLPLKFVSESVYEEKALDWQVRVVRPKYSHLMWYVRLLFTGAWVALIGYIALRPYVIAFILEYRH